MDHDGGITIEAVWDRFLTPRDIEVFSASGFGSSLGFGERPAVLIVDVNYNFVGHERAPILESIKTWPNSCGEVGWDAVDSIARLLKEARGRSLPIIYSTGLPARPDGLGRGLWRSSRVREDTSGTGFVGTDIVKEIAPEERDLVIHKARPSAFFGTALLTFLLELDIDTLILAGTTTSGCVRATVIDAFSHNFKVCIVEEGTFDRGEASHALNLFDMNAKYADVVSLNETLGYIDQLPEGIFTDRLTPPESDTK